MRFRVLFSLILLSCLTINNLHARDKFSAVIQVDEMIITQYEIDQRAKFFKLLNFPETMKMKLKNHLLTIALKCVPLKN